jgi:hypothetical protein
MRSFESPRTLIPKAVRKVLLNGSVSGTSHGSLWYFKNSMSLSSAETAWNSYHTSRRRNHVPVLAAAASEFYMPWSVDGLRCATRRDFGVRSLKIFHAESL